MPDNQSYALKQSRYVCQDGVWYACLDVVDPSGSRLDTSTCEQLHLVERGYVCQDGVWYRQMAAEPV